jgi:subtilisin family serine protease
MSTSFTAVAPVFDATVHAPAGVSQSNSGVTSVDLVATNAPQVPGVNSEQSPAGSWAKARILVAPRDETSASDFDAALAQHGAKSLGKIGPLDVHVVELPAQASGAEEAVAKALAHNPHIKFAEVDRLIAPGGTPNDPSFASEWHLMKVNAPTAWNTSVGSGVVVAILDTGVDGTHPDLAAQMVPGWNFYDNNSNTSDVNGHGTAVAGAAAAATNNDVGVAAVAGSARIMPVRIADPNAYAYWSTVAQGITWAADHGARVANISYVGASASSTVQNASSYFRSKGGVVFVCAGNTGAVDNTASTSLITVVSATDENDKLASFSTYGSFVDISAPGHNILTTARGGGYQYWWGTSLATPIVAGTAALIISKRPDFTPAQVDTALQATATDLGPAGKDVYFGAGRVNAAAAVTYAVSSSTTTATADTTKPTVSIASPTNGASVSGTISVAVNASDNVGVSKVELRVNGSLVATDSSAPYQFGLDTTKYSGTVLLTAVAYDAAGNSGTSSSISVLTANTTTTATIDTSPPSLTITNPGNGITVNGKVTITTSVSDNAGTAGITQVLSIDNVVKGTYAGVPLSYKWNAQAASQGTHTISVTARDKAGNATTKSVQVKR